MSKQIIAGGVAIGGGAPVTIQSMCNTHTEDAKATIAQIHALEAAGCEIVRVTVPNMEAAHALSEIKENISIPLVADIHFDYRLAVEAAARGADKIRINPGNIGDDDRVKAVADACNVTASPTLTVEPAAGDVTETTGVVGSDGTGGTTTPPSMPIARASTTSVAPSENVTVRGVEP